MEQARQSVWRENDSGVFIDDGDFFVPDRYEQFRILAELIPVGGGYVADLCCGSGLLARTLLERDPDLVVYGLDGSPMMLKAAAARNHAFKNRFTPKLFDIKSDVRSWRLPSRLKGVVSTLAIHHLNDVEKAEMFCSLWQALSPGGIVAIADIVRPSSEMTRSIWIAEWEEAVRTQSLALTGTLSSFTRFHELKWDIYRYPDANPLDKPSTLMDQLRWLSEAGFEKIDVHWMRAGHAVFSGEKPAEAELVRGACIHQVSP